MAQKKKATAPAKTAAKKTAAEPVKAAPAPPNLGMLRADAEAADRRVQNAIRSLNHVKADQSMHRDANVREAQSHLENARIDALEAWSFFEAAKKGQKR